MRANWNKLTPYLIEPNKFIGGSFKELLKTNDKAILGEGIDKKDDQELPN